MKLFKNFALTGISTPYGGISWEVRDNSEEKKEILKELYKIRCKLIDFYYEYKIFAKQEEIETINDFDNNIIDALCSKAFPLYFSIEEPLISSRYFVILPKENRKQIFDNFEFLHFRSIEVDQGDNLTDDDKLIIITDLIKLYDTIQKQIEQINKSL